MKRRTQTQGHGCTRKREIAAIERCMTEYFVSQGSLSSDATRLCGSKGTRDIAGRFPRWYERPASRTSHTMYSWLAMYECENQSIETAPSNLCSPVMSKHEQFKRLRRRHSIHNTADLSLLQLVPFSRCRNLPRMRQVKRLSSKNDRGRLIRVSYYRLAFQRGTATRNDTFHAN